MTIETVINKCMESVPQDERQRVEPLIRQDALLQAKRFEKIIRAWYFNDLGNHVVKMMQNEGDSITQTKSRIFEHEKSRLTTSYIRLLCDLYDYK
mgnify:CR=1 FL=1